MSKDIGKKILDKSEIIIESWIKAIREDEEVESAKSLAYKSVRDSIPLVLEAIATLLSESLEDRPQKLEGNSLKHGVERAEQGYDAAEVAREYSLLRKVIYAVLKPDLLTGSTEEALQTLELIDSILDKIISLSLESYVEARLEEVEQVRGQLLLTNQELMRLVEIQKEDLSHLAHELKTPLNSIMGFSTLLLQQHQKVGQEKNKSLNLQLTERVISNSKQLLRLINDVSEISRYEAGKMQLNLEKVDVRSLIRVTIDALEASTHKKNLEIVLGDRDALEVSSDRLKLQQIITNLVTNAIRYTESGTITVICHADEQEQWVLTVTDTGIGMNPEAQAHIFEPYYRASSKKDYAPNSTGLGLAIVEKLVQLLQGKIELVSEVNKGSSFTVTFPLQPEC